MGAIAGAAASAAGAGAAMRKAPARQHKDAKGKPNLVLIHGGGLNTHVWYPTIAALCAQPVNPFGRILALDLPGCGEKRSVDTAAMNRAAVARNLLDEVLAANVAGAILVCHSASNFVMPELSRSGVFSQVCNLEGPVLRKGETGGSIFGKGLIGSDPEHVGNPVDPATATRYELRRAQFCLDLEGDQCDFHVKESFKDNIPRCLLEEPAVAFDATTSPPATYIIAERSTVFPVEWQKRFAARLGPNVRLGAVPGDHLAPLTCPAPLARELSRLYPG